MQCLIRFARISDPLKLLGFFAHARHYRFGELFHAYLLLTHAFFKDVVSVDAFFQRPQPRIVN